MYTDRDQLALCAVPGRKAEVTASARSACPSQWGATRLLSGGGRGVADGQPDGSVAEISDEVQSAAEGLDVAGDNLERGDLAVLDLGHPGDAHPHGGGDLLLAQGQLLAGLGELVPARLGEQLACARLDLLG